MTADPRIHPEAPRPGLPFPVLVLWCLIALAIPLAVALGPTAWDVAVYRNAIGSLRAGHDPYLDAMAVQERYHRQAVHPPGDPPFSYVYSPITLPVLRLAGSLPDWLSGSLYWTLLICGVLVEIAVGMRAAKPGERPYFLYFAPLAVFFPCLLANGIVLGGNIAYILYPAVLLAAVLAWRRHNWLWFYLAVLTASCFKAPLLSLVVIAPLSARRQWLPAALTTLAGVGLFAATPALMPELFKHYLQAVELQFSYNRDFGCSPAGLFSQLLVARGLPYSPGGLLFYLAYAIPVFLTLLYLSRRFLAQAFSLQQWTPVLLVGVILLNPRLLEYDLAAVTLPLALLAWRLLSTRNTPIRTLQWLALLFVAANAIAQLSWTLWKLTAGLLIALCFVGGCWQLLERSGSHAATSPYGPPA